eukprot:gnl/MRDRNA2_/MRDRNA2_38173_c0_seq1.p1 gnl/MRDRNA2_/MRDRNA2_38173_c0~~gnl/MRDRNA2_/MRDRNA2_38173_c0_seq1.p1  ORF type:complete len:247 (-),score=43.22 gnl/MRDRNA2_/MRDRNA2_38173_c0_seq1:71-811(-)
MSFLLVAVVLVSNPSLWLVSTSSPPGKFVGRSGKAALQPSTFINGSANYVEDQPSSLLEKPIQAFVKADADINLQEKSDIADEEIPGEYMPGTLSESGRKTLTVILQTGVGMKADSQLQVEEVEQKAAADKASQGRQASPLPGSQSQHITHTHNHPDPVQSMERDCDMRCDDIMNKQLCSKPGKETDYQCVCPGEEPKKTGCVCEYQCCFSSDCDGDCDAGKVEECDFERDSDFRMCSCCTGSKCE